MEPSCSMTRWEAFKYRHWPASNRDLDRMARRIVAELTGAKAGQVSKLSEALAKSTNELDATVKKIKPH